MLKRYAQIDLFRLIAALMVIGIHTFPFESIDPSLDFVLTHVLFRIAVPFFIMTSGFFISDKLLKDDFGSILKFALKVLKIYVICILLYLPLNFYMYKTGQIELPKLDASIFVNLIKIFVFDSTMYHFWYFPAMAMGILISWLLLRRGMYYSILVSSFLYLVGIMGDSYYGLIEGSALIYFYDFIGRFSSYTRNGIFYVPIFLILGVVSKSYRIGKRNMAIASIVLFAVLMISEGLILRNLEVIRHDSMYLFLPILCFMIFAQILHVNRMEAEGQVQSLHKLKQKILNLDLSFISLCVYVIHPYVIVGVRMVAKIMKLESIFVENSVIHFVLVAIISFVLSYYLSIFKKILRGKNGKFGKVQGMD